MNLGPLLAGRWTCPPWLPTHSEFSCTGSKAQATPCSMSLRASRPHHRANLGHESP